MTNLSKFFAAFALVAAASSAAAAQTDFGSPLGAGAGVGGSVAPLGVPSEGSAIPARGLSGLENARNSFGAAPATGLVVVSPAGGNVNVQQNVAQAISALLSGNATAAQRSAVTTAIGTSNAGELVSALGALGANTNIGTLRGAVAAYNSAIDAVSGTPSAALLGIRQALFAISQQ